MNVKTKHGSFASLFSAHVHALSESFAGISLLFRSKSVVYTHHVSKLLNFLCFNFFSILVSFMYIAKYWRRLVCAHLWSDGNTHTQISEDTASAPVLLHSACITSIFACF